jgi:nucleotide-binding universal stress UspA family protein
MTTQIRRILLLTDFCCDTLPMIEYVAGFAREHDAEIVLIHVVEPLPRSISRWYESSRLIEQCAENARERLEHCEREAADAYPRCRSELHFGPAIQVIADLEKKLDADLIVVPAHRRTSVFDLLLGGLSERLARRTSCPVLAVNCGLPSFGETGSDRGWESQTYETNRSSSHAVRFA